MTDKKHTPEGWEKDWEKVNKELNGVNPHAYRLGWLQGRKPLEGIDNPAEWVKQMKLVDVCLILQNKQELLSDLLFTVERFDAENKQLKHENERLRAALTEIRNYNSATSGYSNEAAMKRIAGEAIKGE